MNKDPLSDEERRQFALEKLKKKRQEINQKLSKLNVSQKEIDLIPLAREYSQTEIKLVYKLNTLKNVNPFEFEELIGKMYRKMGFNVKVTNKFRDGGVDLILTQSGSRTVVQCKRYKGSVSVNEVRELIGTRIIERASKAILITTGTFTKQAIKEAKSGNTKVELINGPELTELLNKYLN